MRMVFLNLKNAKGWSRGWSFFPILGGILVPMMFLAMPAKGQGYTSDIDRRATVGSAKRILGDNGGLFFGPEDLRQIFNTRPVNVPYRLPYTERAILECGQCVLFPTVGKIGYRGAATSILSLLRAPEAKRLFQWGHSRRIPWFKDEPFARTPLRTEWHLIRLDVEGRGTAPTRQQYYRGYERLPKANTAFFMLLLLPPKQFSGEYFFTSDTAHGGKNVVIVGRPMPGTIDVYFAPKRVGRADTGRLAEIVPNDRRDYRKTPYY